MLQRAVRLLALLAATSIIGTGAFKSQDFKTCSQSGFCRRGRALAERAGASKNWQSPYVVDANTVAISSDKSAFTASVRSSLYPDIKFQLDLSILEDGVIRAQMDEVDGLRKRYDEASSWALISKPPLSKSIQWTKGSNEIHAKYGEKKEIEARVSFSPFRISLLRNGKEEILVNGDGLFHMEHFRTKPEPPAASSSEETSEEPATDGESAQKVIEKPARPQAWFEGEDEDAWWEETFSSWTDSKPKGTVVLNVVAHS
jgi:mannosyl-oligosaccharide alpha-1,3-glucosidase